jgi:hypothetical protein
VKRKNRIRSFTFVAETLSAVILFAARAQCSGEDISDYVQSGATPDQLRALCGQAAQGPAQAQAAAICVTVWNACQMAILLPSGSPCACYTRQGTIPGIAR